MTGLIGECVDAGVPGAIIISILAITAVAVVLGLAEFKGIASAPPSTPTSTGRYSLMYGRSVARSSL